MFNPSKSFRIVKKVDQCMRTTIKVNKKQWAELQALAKREDVTMHEAHKQCIQFALDNLDTSR